MGRLSSCATTTEAHVPGAHAPQQGRATAMRPAHRNEEWPPLTTTGESPRAAMKTQRSQK